MNKFILGAIGAFALSGCAEMASITLDGMAAAAGVSSNSSSSNYSGRDSNNRVVSIYNRTGVTMTRFYGSSANVSSWGRDRLGSSVMYSGQSMSMNFDDGSGSCHYDFKAEFSDGDVLYSSDVNVCVVSEWGWR